MARLARVVLPDCSYHVTHRGNRCEDVFFTDDDRLHYLWWLREYAERYAMEVWAYCLMTNHVLCAAAHKKCYRLPLVMRSGGRSRLHGRAASSAHST